MTAVVPERPASRQAASAPWLVGLALSLAGEECDEDLAVKQLVSEAGGSRRVLEGAYGRAVALVAEYPDDPQVRATLDLLARALHRMLRDGEARA
jgi:hypothetical protein